MSDYASRFSTIAEAIAYGESNGQGPLTLQSDGVVTNQSGQIMVYDSDGNLAPGGGTYGGAPTPAPEPAPTPVLGEFGRFNSQAEAIAYAESSIQGPLTIQSDGVITNRNGEYMVYDSDGNLAPGGLYKSAPGFVPAPVAPPAPTPVLGEFGRFNSVAEAIAYATPTHGQLSVQADGSITRQQDGKIMVFDDEGNLAQGSEYYDGVLDPSLVIDPNPQPIKVYESRFATVNEAIAYAEANGQGVLTLQPDGVITNQEGRYMDYDSDGNLAPGGLYQSAAGFVPAGKFGRFNSQEEAIAYAESSIQGPLTIQPDGVITNRFGEVMGYDSDGNLAPMPSGGSPALEPTPALPLVGSPEYEALLLETGRTDLVGFDYAAHLATKDSGGSPVPAKPEYINRFDTVEEAVKYAESNGQGLLTIQPDGVITNRFGEVMGYDSDGNLAPGQGPAPITKPAPAPGGEFGRFMSVSDAITYATATGQGVLKVHTDGSITNQSNQVMVYDSDGNLAPGSTIYAGSDAGIVLDPVGSPLLNTVKIPLVGSPEYEALLLETGRTNLVGFNYAAHLAVKDDVNPSALDSYLRAASGGELVEQLESVDLGALFATASASQILELTTKFGGDPIFAAFLSKQITPIVPAVGTAEYEQLLEDTGKTDLTDFDYQSYLNSVTDGEQALISFGLSSNYTSVKFISRSGSDIESELITEAQALIGSSGSEKVTGGSGDDVLISSGGEDVLVGGEGMDSVLISKPAAESEISRDSITNDWVVKGASGSDTLVEVERVVFEDSSIALDIDKNQAGGQAALILGALLGPDSVDNPAYVGTVIKLLDDGMSIDELAVAAIEALGLTSNDALVTLLWSNIVGSEPTESEKASVIRLLDDGLSPGELIVLALNSEINESNIDLIGISQSGLPYIIDGLG
jgi:serralysin